MQRNPFYREILIKAGVLAHIVNGRHQPCPNCGGIDRFRFTNHNNTGAWQCNACKPEGGTPTELLMQVSGLNRAAAGQQLVKAFHGVVYPNIFPAVP